MDPSKSPVVAVSNKYLSTVLNFGCKSDDCGKFGVLGEGIYLDVFEAKRGR